MLKTYATHPVADLFPMMTDAEIQVLANDIKTNGLQEPVVFYDGTLLDGRNRVKACKIVGVDVKHKLWDGEGDPTNWIISKNLHRRHMTESQRARVADELARLIFAGPAKERQREHGGTAPGKSRDQHLAPIEAKCPTLGKATEQAAAMMSVGASSVERAGRVRRRAIPALQEAVTKGDMSLNAVDILSTLSHEEQAELANDLQQAKKRAGELRTPKRAPAPSPSPLTHKTMSRKGLKPPPDPLSALTSLANDVVDTWERETESDGLTTRWEQASAIQRETFIKSLNALIASTRRIKKGLNNDAQGTES